MKKSVILLILIVYVGSVFVVGLLGVKMNLGEQIKYVEKIEYIPQGTLDQTKSDDKKTLYVDGERWEWIYAEKKNGVDVAVSDKIVKNKNTGKFESVSFELDFNALPDDAKTLTLEFSYDTAKEENGTIKVEKDVKGFGFTVTFYKNDTVTFTVRPTVQGDSDVKLTVTVSAVL